jgi:hypothetical protein
MFIYTCYLQKRFGTQNVYANINSCVPILYDAKLFNVKLNAYANWNFLVRNPIIGIRQIGCPEPSSKL